MAISITRFDIEKLDGNIIQNHRGSKQVGLKQLGLKQVGFKQLGHKQVRFKQLGTVFEIGVHRVSNDDAAVAQRRLEDKQLEERTNTDCLVKEQEKVHLGIKVGEDITVTGVPDQEGPKGNVAGRKKKRYKEAKLRNLLKYRSGLNESYDNVESFIHQNDLVSPFYEAHSRNNGSRGGGRNGGRGRRRGLSNNFQQSLFQQWTPYGPWAWSPYHWASPPPSFLTTSWSRPTLAS
ncbi:hypothetical protein Tco_0655909 [Tanacetum coccineum]|uniref:Uncharacterized protein n=1 Tax=Tanacetum coccineum TaxID=301880 RepID=A0ABQ4X7B0_9ASTR